MSFFNLPVLAFLKNGVQTPVNKDTVTPANSTPLPVELVSASGTVAVNAANLSLEVATSGTGSNPDSMQITDGTNTLAVNPDGSINVTAGAGPPNVAGQVIVVTVNQTTWTALGSLSSRRALNVQNRSGQEIKLNYSSGIVGYVGIVVDNLSDRFYDLGPSVVVYAKSQTSSCSVTVEELS